MNNCCINCEYIKVCGSCCIKIGWLVFKSKPCKSMGHSHCMARDCYYRKFGSFPDGKTYEGKNKEYMLKQIAKGLEGV